MGGDGNRAEYAKRVKAGGGRNIKKKIPARKVPRRDNRYVTDVPGIYIIGDVAGVPLIKMAMNKGVRFVECVTEDLEKENGKGKAEYDLAIIGIGPGGLAAVAIAAQK